MKPTKSVFVLFFIFAFSIYFNNTTDTYRVPNNSLLETPDVAKPQTLYHRALYQMTLTILDRYPPDKYYYIGLGGSTAPIEICMDIILGHGYRSNIPLSSDLNEKLKNASEETREIMERNLKEHFDHFFPKNKIGNKKVLVFDFSGTGRGLYGGVSSLRKTFPNLTFQGLGFYNKGWFYPGENWHRKNNLSRHGFHHMEIDPFEGDKHFIGNLFRAQAFDPYREFEKFDVTKHIQGEHYVRPEINRENSKLVKAIERGFLNISLDQIEPLNSFRETKTVQFVRSFTIGGRLR